MSIIKPGCDSRHIIEQARRAKGLATLSIEDDAYQAGGRKPIIWSQIHKPEKTPVRFLYNKAELEAFAKSCEGKTPDEIFEKLGIKVQYNANGSKSISHYRWPFTSYCFKAAGIDEEALLEGVTSIQGSCNLTGSELKNLGSVTRIGRDLIIPLFTKADDLSSIKSIGGNIKCDAERTTDVIDLVKRLKLNPQIFQGRINPTIYSFGLYNIPHNMDGALKLLQARAEYEAQAQAENEAQMQEDDDE